MKIVKLEDVCEFINGDRGKNYPKSNEFVDMGIPFINAGHIKNSKIDFTKMNYISEASYEKLGSGKIQNGDILFCLRGSLGKSAFIDFDKGAIASSLVILRNKNNRELNSTYLMYLLNSHIISSQIERTNNGSSQPNLSAKSVKNYDIPLPNINVQNKIVQVLNLAQKLINRRKLQMKELDQLKQSLFVEMFGDVMENPKDWEINKLSDVYEIIDGDRGKNYPKQNEFYDNEYCLFLNAGNVTNNGFSFKKTMFITKEKDEILRKGKLQRHDLIITTRGTVGNVAYYDDKVPFDNIRINSGMVILRKKKEINPLFFTYYFRNPSVYRSLISGTAQPQMPISNLKNAKIYYPPLALQNKFGEIAQQIDMKKAKIEKSRNLLEENFNALMQRAFKGELFSEKQINNI